MINFSNSKSTLYLLMIFNLMVLLGQVWPAGAPPFARWVNILFLIANAGFLISILVKSSKGDAKE
ncbi:MAG: hypothetical protein IPJ54_05510 [Saprospiraceae bacterium]|nr:hypothetical protein [Saprospiraceae bacterium]